MAKRMNKKNTCLIQIQFYKAGQRKHETCIIECPEISIDIQTAIGESLRSQFGETGFKEVEPLEKPGVHSFEIKGKSISMVNQKRYRLK